MGILDDILGPIETAIHSIEKPVHMVVSLFGDVIKLTEEFIAELENMIEDLRNLFNASNVETMFLSPFKNAALVAIDSVDKLYDLIAQISAPTVNGVKGDLMIPIDACYMTMRRGMTDTTSKLGALITRLEQDGKNVAHSIYSDFNRIKATLQTFPTEIDILKRKIEGEFKVIDANPFSVLPDISDMNESTGMNTFSVVKRVGQVVAVDFSNFERSLKRRFDNENIAIDLFYMVIISGILAVLVIIYMATKSISLIVMIMVMILISIVIYAIVEFILGVI